MAPSSSAPTKLPHRERQGPRARPLLGGLALLVVTGAGAGLASHSFGARSDRPTSSVSSAPTAITTPAPAQPQSTRAEQRVAPANPPLSDNEATDPESEANVFRGVGPGVPEAYTGDPAGQALWEKTVEEDQQTIQPDDLIEEPPVPLLDLRNNPAYKHLKLDADGNVNE